MIDALLQRIGLPAMPEANVDGLRALHRAYLASVPYEDIAVQLGETGTLEKRFVGNPAEGRLRAKTGTLNQVTSLAGYIDTVPGATLSFTYLLNVTAPTKVTADDVALQDELGAILVTYPEGPNLEALGPVPP